MSDTDSKCDEAFAIDVLLSPEGGEGQASAIEQIQVFSAVDTIHAMRLKAQQAGNKSARSSVDELSLNKYHICDFLSMNDIHRFSFCTNSRITRAGKSSARKR